MRTYQQGYMIMFRGGNIENDLDKRIKTLNALFIEILTRFESQLINTRGEQSILFQQVHYPAIVVGGTQPDLFPFLFMLLVKTDPYTLGRFSFRCI